MSINNMEELLNVSTDMVLQWLQTMLELQQQQIADMHVNQQCQYEEIQQLTQQGTSVQMISTLTESEINPLNAARPLKECLGVPAYFDASDLTLYLSWRLDMLVKLSILEAGGQSWEDRMKISMLKKALTFKLLQVLNSGRRCYTPATHTPAPKNNADAMDWVDSNVYTQARVSAVRTGF
ncbi:hypothetical protein GX50_08862 [[Emmonsia] crescens]|uniref:Uncharacterized protein n=1 Tax=[Emmonsia] crescens TaxID=73230 RepID=A0A2B7Z4W2_9EURO|nr:hypothetical protein GX50_08862 [Emmonsia crescens]